MQDVQLHVFDASMNGVGEIPVATSYLVRAALVCSLPDAGSRLENDNLAVGLNSRLLQYIS